MKIVPVLNEKCTGLKENFVFSPVYFCELLKLCHFHHVLAFFQFHVYLIFPMEVDYFISMAGGCYFDCHDRNMGNNV